MKKQSEMHKRAKISLLILVLLGGVAMAMYGQACGDVDGNGSVDIVDALKIAQYYVGLNPSGFNIGVADVDNNGTVDIVDALRIAQYYVGLGVTLTCGGTGTVAPTPVTTAAPTTVPTQGPTAVPGTHVDNPYSGASLYVNADWASKASANGGSAIANCPTFVWMDRVAAITGGSGSCTFTGLTAHLDKCVANGKNAIQLVIYDLPNRDCSASASNGEFTVANNGINNYKTLYIDPIVAILKNYGQLRLICFLEPDSTSNMVTNLSVANCAEANSSGAYSTGIQYAIDQLKSVGSNVYIYLDASHDAWIGWASNFQPFVNYVANMVQGSASGKTAIDGFVSNSANTLPYDEPFCLSGTQTVNGQQLQQSRFYDWNPYTMERTYIQDLRNAFISAGFPSTIGFLHETSRNGWGGPNRPKAASTSTDLNTWVDQSRVDRRYHRGNWCNQGSAGIGARPATAPTAGIDAFVWIKPPGESDGQAALGTDPCDPNKTLDNMCKPGGVNTYCNCGSNEAMAGAPAAGAWFQALFDSLKANANPAL
jgi:cellulose 1,4-beta-cellobiosidase